MDRAKLTAPKSSVGSLNWPSSKQANVDLLTAFAQSSLTGWIDSVPIEYGKG